MADLPGHISDTELYYDDVVGGTGGRISYIDFCQREPVALPITLPLCGEEPGADAARGGWLEALLVDVGGGVTVVTEETPRPTVSATVLPQADPAPTGLAGLLVEGGAGVIGSANYYAIVGVYGAEYSELSAVIGPYQPSGTARAVQLTWNALPGAPNGVRVYRSSTPDFSSFDIYRPTGLPYGGANLPGNATSLLDEYPGVNIGMSTSPDPHWDGSFKRAYFYQVSAIFDDGTQSPCGDSNVVELAPRNHSLTVRVTWTAPAGGTVVGYRVRRQGQIHYWGFNLDRQWDVGAGTLQLDDTNTDEVTAASACGAGVEIAGDLCTSGRPKYLLAGHTLKAVDQVYVKRPDPAAAGTDTASTPVWVLQQEGIDYEQAVCEINGNRYHVLVFTELQRSPTCEFYPVTANVQGVETNGDGTGLLLTNLDDIFEHLMLNVIFNTYRSSIGLYAPPGGTPYFEDVPYSPGLFNRASVTAAKAVAAARIPGGYQGAGALTALTPARQLVHDLLVTGDLELYQYQGPWYVRRPDTGSVVRGSLQTITPATGIIKDSFEPTIEQAWHYNMLPYFAGPLNSSGTEGFLLSGEIYDDPSIDFYRRVVISEPVYLLWTHDPSTAYDVVRRYVTRSAYPPVTATFAGPVRWYNLPVGSYVLVTHPSGLGASGWVSRACKVLSVDLDLDKLECYVRVQDVDHEVP